MRAAPSPCTNRTVEPPASSDEAATLSTPAEPFLYPQRTQHKPTVITTPMMTGTGPPTATATDTNRAERLRINKCGTVAPVRLLN